MGNKMTKDDQDSKEQKKSPFQKLLARFQMCPNKPEKWSSKKVSPGTKVQALPPPPKPPLRNHTERMQSNDEEDLKKSEWTEVPLQVPDSPPKQNHKDEIKITPIPPPRKHKLRIQEILEIPKKAKNVQADIATSRTPVEEPLIVPQKVVEHVCDGTHHHVRNVFDGKVVDQIITHKEVHKKKSSTKNASSLSLPSHDDLKKKDEKRARSPTKIAKNKSSASSLPTDKKQKSVNSAAERLESYMTRCKSIGSIIPHKNDKSKSTEHDSDKESEDSWGGLDDWDLGIIEHDVSIDVPHVPLKNVRQKQQAISNKSPEKHIAKPKVDTKRIDQFINSIADDFSTENKLKDHTEEERTSSRQGTYPFKVTPGKSAFENDAFFTTEFLKSESRHNNASETNKPTPLKLAPLAAFDSDKESEKDASSDISDSKKTVGFTLIDRMQTTKMSDDFNAKEKPDREFQTERDKPFATPRRKSSTGHSNLLKFISNDFNKSQNDIPVDENSKKFTKQVIEKLEEIHEPEIVPELRNLDRSWQRLIKSDEVNNAPFLDQESSISDLVETSSDDTRSTTRGIAYT